MAVVAIAISVGQLREIMLDIILTPARHIGLRQDFLRIEFDLVFFGAVFRPLAWRVPFLLDRPTRDVPLQGKLSM